MIYTIRSLHNELHFSLVYNIIYTEKTKLKRSRRIFVYTIEIHIAIIRNRLINIKNKNPNRT